MVAAVGSPWFASPLRRASGVGIVAALSLSASPAYAQTASMEPAAIGSYLAGAAVLILLALLFLAFELRSQE